MAHGLRIGRESVQSLLALDLEAMLSLRALLLLLVPVIELFALIRAAEVVGGAVAILALFGLSALGAIALRAQGGLAIRSLSESLTAGAAPASVEVADRVVRFFAAALIAVPGFVTGLVGLLLFVPPVRALIRPMVQSRAETFVRPTLRFRGGVVDVSESAAKPPTQTQPRLR